MPLPLFNIVTCFIQSSKPVLIQAFVPELAVEAFHKSILSWLTWLNEAQANAFGFAPEEHRLAGKLAANVANNRIWLVSKGYNFIVE